MAILGQGIVPSGSIGSELTYVTRRAFIPKLVVQIYNASPLISALIANAQMASGGVSGVTVPVQGTAMVQSAWSDYTGTFAQPAVTPGITNAEYNLDLNVTPVPFLGMEGAVQINAAIIPIIEARMNDAGNAVVDQLSTTLFTAGTTDQSMLSLPDIISSSNPASGASNIGGIDRSANTFWQAKVIDAGGTDPTRNKMLEAIVSTVKNSAEMPDFGVMGPGTWAKLAQDYTGLERYNIAPGSSFDQDPNGARALFTALMVSGVPFYFDPYMPEGYAYLINMNYLNLYIHEAGQFVFTGFESTLPNWQVGYVGAVLTIAELVSTKPKSMTKVTGYNYLNI